MKPLYTMTPQQKTQWEEWKDTLPPEVHVMTELFPVNFLFRIRQTGLCCTIWGYSAQFLQVCISESHNPGLSLPITIITEVNPEDLEECDLSDREEEAVRDRLISLDVQRRLAEETS